MTITPEWHRSDNEYSILLYTLKQDGWKRGEPVMVNDLTIRIENGPGSNHDLGPIADKLLVTLTPASTEPVAWRYRPADGGVWSKPEYSRRSAYGRIGCEEQPLYAHPAPVTVESAARETALKIMQMEVETFCRRVEAGEIRSKRTYAAFTDCLRALSWEKS